MRIPKILHLILAIPILFAFSMPKAYAADITDDFTDANFLSCVSTALGTPGSVDSVDAAALLNLSCSNKSIASIAGAENLTSLEGLDLSYNSITSLSPISGLTTLESINVNNNDISSIAALANSTGLLSVQASYNSDITDISVLADLPGLISVTLHYTGIDDADLVNLEDLTDLILLSIAGNGITDISGLSGLVNLTTAFFNDNAITDVSVLSGMTSMERLYLGDNPDLNDISDLSTLINVWDLDLGGCDITSASALSGMTAMDTLYLDNNNLTSISALSGMNDLRMLGINNNNISSISALSGKTNLEYLYIYSNPSLSDISPLEDSTLLKYLSASWNDISSISVLSSLTNLETLTLVDNNISDLTPLQDLTKLTSTQLGLNTFTDLSPLNDGINGPGSTCDPDTEDCSCTSCFADNNTITIANNEGLLGFNAISSLEQIAILEDTPSTTVNHDVTTDVSSFFDDSNFLACVELALGTPGEVQIEDAMALTGTLDCSDEGIQQIGGVQFFTGISTLNLSTNSISDWLYGSDLSLMADLDNLTSLILNNNYIRNLDDLTGLDSLTTLNLSYNQLNSSTNLGALTGSTNLSTLNLANNTLTDLNGLDTYVNLTTLNLSNNTGITTNLSDVDWSELTNLTSLDLSNTGLSVLTPLGSGNTDIDGFSSFNTIDVRTNTSLSAPANYAAALTEIGLIEAAGAPNNGVVLYDINYEICDNDIDDDGDGDIDEEDDFCTVAFYVDYDTGGTTECTLAEPCYRIGQVFSRTAFNNKIGTEGATINIYVQGSYDASESLSKSGVLANIHIQPWNSTPKLESVTLSANNITFEGFEVSNDKSSMGIIMAHKNAVIKNNYIHNTQIGIMGYDVASVGVTGNKIHNNIIYDNNDYAGGYCGGIVIINANETEVFNNTVYNNCDGVYAFGFGDIALTSFMAYGLPAPQDSIVKQNLVYNTIGGNKYYYNVGAESINGSSPGGVLTDADAASHGTGNNFIASTDPFVDSTNTADYSEVSTGFALDEAEYEDYQIGSMAVGTPVLDFLGVTRPTGTGEAGAMEYEDGGGVCTPGDGQVCINGIINSGLAMVATDTSVTMEVSPVLCTAAGVPTAGCIAQGEDSATDTGTLTIQNNDPAGFTINVAMAAGVAGAGTANTLSSTTTGTDLVTEGGVISWASAETAVLTGGTDYTDNTFTTDELVYTNATGGSQCVDGTVIITYKLQADETVAPAADWIGYATYTAAAL